VDAVLVFRKRAIESQLEEVEYTKEWAQDDPDAAVYVSGERASWVEAQVEEKVREMAAADGVEDEDDLEEWLWDEQTRNEAKAEIIFPYFHAQRGEREWLFKYDVEEGSVLGLKFKPKDLDRVLVANPKRVPEARRILKDIVAPENVMALSQRRLREMIEEGKAIGSAMLKAGVGDRDAPLRFRSPTEVRQAIRQAGSNAPRALQAVYQEASRILPTIVTDLSQGRSTLPEAQAASAIAMRRLYERMREIGRRASGLRELGADEALFREEERWFRSAVREELRYWNTFLQEVVAGTARNLPDRVGAYIDALRFMYEAARIAAMPDNTLLHWVGPRDEKLCAGCAYLMEMSPFVKDNIPAVPRDGQTSCLTHCRHRIVVRVANNLNEVVRRRQQLPRRDEMTRELKRRQGRRGRALVSPAPAARNPFQGDPMTGRVSRPIL